MHPVARIAYTSHVTGKLRKQGKMQCHGRTQQNPIPQIKEIAS